MWVSKEMVWGRSFSQGMYSCLRKPSPKRRVKRNKKNSQLSLCVSALSRRTRGWGELETSGPWFRNCIHKAARYEDSASGCHLPAETEPRWLGREVKEAREPEASTGWGLLPGPGEMRTGGWACGCLSRCCPWCFCRRATFTLDCEVTQVRPGLQA